MKSVPSVVYTDDDTGLNAEIAVTLLVAVRPAGDSKKTALHFDGMVFIAREDNETMRSRWRNARKKLDDLDKGEST